MSSKADRTIVEALGIASQDTTKVDFTATPASGVMDTDATYRVVADQDCYLKFSAPGDANVADTDMLMMAGVPEVFQTGKTTLIGVLRKSADGSLHATRMKTPGR